MKDIPAAEIPWKTQAAIYGAGLFSFTMVLISSLIVALLAVQLTESEFLIGVIIGSRYFLTLVLFSHKYLDEPFRSKAFDVCSTFHRKNENPNEITPLNKPIETRKPFQLWVRFGK